MPSFDPGARAATVTLLAASVPLKPDTQLIHARLGHPALDWQDVLYLADGHGITPLLYQLWRALDLFAQVPDSAQARMAQTYLDNATRNADARREFVELLELLSSIGVETIVLKGPPLIAQLYDDPAERVLYDLDFLARNEEQAQRGFEKLLALGYTPVPTKAGAVVSKHLPAVWRLNGFLRRGYLFDVAQPRPVELHLTLWDTEWRGLEVHPLPDLWARSQITPLYGMAVRTLSLEDTFVHLCVHLATHLVEREARVGQAIDIARLLNRRGAELDWARVLAAGNGARVTRFLYLALRTVNLVTGAPLPPPDVFDSIRAQTPPRLRSLTDRDSAADLLTMDYRQPNLSRAYALTFAAAQSWREKARVARFALVPARSSLEREYGSSGPWALARHLGGRGRSYVQSLTRQRAGG